MLPKSIHQAEQRVLAAIEALAAFKSAADASDVGAAQRHWWTFLVAVDAVYKKLEQGSKCCGKCTPWFGRLKGVRRDDELLSYLHHARNSDLHSLDEVTVDAPQQLSITTTGEFGMAAFTIDFDMRYQENPEPDPVVVTYKITSDSGVELEMPLQTTQSYQKKQLTLVKVKDTRYGDSWTPPTSHNGLELTDVSPYAVGSLAVDYLQAAITDASAIGCDLRAAP